MKHPVTYIQYINQGQSANGHNHSGPDKKTEPQFRGFPVDYSLPAIVQHINSKQSKVEIKRGKAGQCAQRSRNKAQKAINELISWLINEPLQEIKAQYH